MRRIVRLAFGALLAGVLATSAMSAAAQEQPVTLDLWIFEGEDTVLPRFKQDFEASHPGITLEVTLIPEDLYVTKLDTAFAAGSPPDLAFVYDRRWIKSGAFVPVDELLAANGINLSRYAQGALGNCFHGDRLYCIGSYLGLVVLLYDRQAFDAAGIQYPSATDPMSVDDYAAIAGQLSRPDPDLSKRVWGGEVAATYWWMDSATMFSPDGRTTIGYVDDEDTIHSWSTLAQMARDGNALTAAEQEAAAMQSADLFPTHQIGMTLDDNTFLGEVQAQGVGVGVAPVPVEKAGDQAWMPAWTDQWGIPAQSDHQEEALAFLVWVATEGNRIRAELGSMPLDVALAEETDWASGAAERPTLVDLAGRTRPPTFVPGLFAVLGATFEDAFNRTVETGDAARALHDAASILQSDLDREWETWEAVQ